MLIDKEPVAQAEHTRAGAGGARHLNLFPICFRGTGRLIDPCGSLHDCL